MQPSKILVIDDEQNIADVLKANLVREGYKVETANDGPSGLEKAIKSNPDLVILDCMLPGMDGYDVLKKIRLQSSVPVLMLTAKTEEINKILGLELGADDYITKPFSVREVLARVKAHLRRLTLIDSLPVHPTENELKFGELTIDLKSLQLRKNGELVNLTLREFELLTFLAQNAGQVFSREQLLERVWGYEYFGDVRTVDVTIRRTREKIESDVKNSNYKYILTKRGVGYYFTKNQGSNF